MDYKSKNSYDNQQKISYKTAVVKDVNKKNLTSLPAVLDEKFKYFTHAYAVAWLALSVPFITSIVEPTTSGLEFFGLLLFPLYILAVVYAPLHLLHFVSFMKSRTISLGWKVYASVINIVNLFVLGWLLMAFVARV